MTENGQPKPLIAGTRIRLSFAADGANVGAYAGCNSEQAMLAVVRDTVTYEVEADVLRLRHPSGKGLDLRADR